MFDFTKKLNSTRTSGGDDFAEKEGE